jgi:hypothetical protein
VSSRLDSSHPLEARYGTAMESEEFDQIGDLTEDDLIEALNERM